MRRATEFAWLAAETMQDERCCLRVEGEQRCLVVQRSKHISHLKCVGSETAELEAGEQFPERA